METTKICSKCNQELNIDLFQKDKANKDGYKYICKECIKKYFVRYYENNKEKYQQYGREYSKEYIKTEKGKISNKNNSHKRRELTKDSDLTTDKLLEFKNNSKKCYWCGCNLKNVKYHIDHYTPLSKGGEHTLSNLVISCDKCNLKKNAKDPLEFANSIGRLL